MILLLLRSQKRRITYHLVKHLVSIDYHDKSLSFLILMILILGSESDDEDFPRSAKKSLHTSTASRSRIESGEFQS